jgi:hypothetical protein
MGKYRSSVYKKTTPKSDGPHAVWRGIGCLMMLIIPVISYAAGYETINYAIENNIDIPYQLLGTPRYPDFFYNSGSLISLLSPLTAIKNLYAYVIAAIFYTLILGGVTSVGYAIVYRFTGPSRYGPLDIPQPNIKVKRYKR